MNILIITNLVLPAVTPEQLAAIEAAAGPGSRITVAGDRTAALAYLDSLLAGDPPET